MSDARLGRQARVTLFNQRGPVAALCCFCALTFLAASAQGGQSDPPAPPDTGQASAQPPSDDEIEVTFSFKDQTWEEILDFFSRVTGLPIVREVAAPDGTVTYIYPYAYKLDEALETLNILLQTKGVMLRRENDRLFLQQLGEMRRENIPTFVGTLPQTVTDDQIVTVLVPLLNAEATSVAEQLTPLVAEYGSITAMPKQNAILLVETAAQIRRISMIVEEIDREDVENIVEFVPIVHAKVEELAASLTSLMSERVVKYVVDAKGKQVKVEDQELPGLKITADARTNAIIAKGTRSRIDTLKETITLLDVPKGGAVARTLRTVRVQTVTPTEAAATLTQFFAAMPEDRRPTVLALDQVEKITLVGDATAVAEGLQLLAALDETSGNPAIEHAMVTELLPLTHANATATIPAILPMLDQRTQRSLTLVAGPDGESIIARGPAASVQAAAALLQFFDRPARVEKTLEFAMINSSDPIMAFERAQTVYAATTDADDPAFVLQTSFEPNARRVTLIGTPQAIAMFKAALTKAQATVIAPRRVTKLPVHAARPSAIAGELTTLSRQLLDPRDGTPFEAPRVEALDELNLLVVESDPNHIETIRELLATLDTASAGRSSRIIQLEIAHASDIKAQLESLLASAPVVVDERTMATPVITVVEPINGLHIVADDATHAVIARYAVELDTVEPNDLPPMRFLPVRTADATALAAALTESYSLRKSEDAALDPVRITADAQTNSLVIQASSEVFAAVQSIVKQLNDVNTLDDEDREVRIFPLRVARAEELAKTLDEMFPQPPMPHDSRGRPRPDLQLPREVVVRADRQTNSIIVDAPAQRLSGFEKLVEQLDRAQIADETEIKTWRLLRSELATVQQTLQRIVDAGGFGSVNGVGAASVTISTDPASGTLLVSGPKEIFEKIDEVITALQEGGTTPTTSLRFFRLTSARAETLVPVLQSLLASRIREALPGAVDHQSLLDVSADRKTNMLIVQAPEAVMPIAEEVIKQLDTGTSAIGDPVIRVRSLTFADPAQVAVSLREAFPTVISKATGDPIDVRLIAAPGSGALIMVGLAADLDEVEALIAPLDERPAIDAVDAQTFELKWAEAVTIAPLVQRLLADQQQNDPRILMERIRRSRGQITLEPQTLVEADPRTNSLIVSGPQQTLALARTLIEQLDRQQSEVGRTTLMFTPMNANPAQLAETARRVLAATGSAGARRQLELIADGPSGVILIVGTAEATANAESMLKAWDQRAALPPMDLVLIGIEHGDAEAIAAIVRPLLSDHSRWPADLRMAARSGLAIGSPTVTAQPESNRLLVSAPQALVPVARALIAQLDVAPDRIAGEVRVYSLRQAQATDVAAAIQRALTDLPRAAGSAVGPTVVAEQSSNSILVTATHDEQAKIALLIEGFDSGTASDATGVRTVFLKNARAETIAPIVEALMRSDEQLPESADWRTKQDIRRDRARHGLADPPMIRVKADRRLNAVLIAGPPALLAVAEKAVEELDVDPSATPNAQVRSVRVIAVRNADASALATNLRALFDDESDNETPPTIQLDAASNALLVRASEAQFATIEAVTKDIEAASIGFARELRTIPIDPSRADAAQVARLLEHLLNQGDESSIVEVVPLESLLETFGTNPQAKDPAPKTQSSAAVSSRLRLVVGILLGAQEGAVVASDIVIAVDSATNSLIVLGSPQSVARVRALAEQAQNELPAEATRIRAIPLPDTINPSRLRTLLESTLQTMRLPGGQTGGLRARVGIMADETGHQLIINASDRDFKTVASILAVYARQPTRDAFEVRTYQLANASADRAVRGLAGLLARSHKDGLSIEIEGVESDFNPSDITAITDPQSNALLVMAPKAAFPFVDKFLQMLDQEPKIAWRSSTLLKLQFANAKKMALILTRVFEARARGLRGTGLTFTRPDIIADDRTNTLLVTGSVEQFGEIQALLTKMDVDTLPEKAPLEIIELAFATPKSVRTVIDEVVLGADQSLRARTLIVADDNAGVLLVRAETDVLADIKSVIAELDRDSTASFPVRSIVLQRADAGAVAQAIQSFYDDRARIASGARGQKLRRQVAVIGDTATSTLLVSASEDDFADVEKMITTLDSVEATKGLEFRVFPLQHAQAEETIAALRELAGPLFRQRSGRGAQPDQLSGSAIPRLNAVLITGNGEMFAAIGQIIEAMDQPTESGTERVVRVYPIQGADLRTVVDVVREALGVSNNWNWWGDSSNDEQPMVESDRIANIVIVSATKSEQAEAKAVIDTIEAAVHRPEQHVEVFALKYAPAREVARTLRDFLEDRAENTGQSRTLISISASESANTILVSAGDDGMATIEDLLSRIDLPEASGERQIEVIALARGEAREIAQLIGKQFPRRSGLPGVIVTADARTNALIVTAPKIEFAQVKALVEHLDGPPMREESLLRTFILERADAGDVLLVLEKALSLDKNGRTQGTTIKIDGTDSEAVEVVARIVADERSNTLLVAATQESFTVIDALIAKLEEAPSVTPIEYRIIPLKHAEARDVTFNLDNVFSNRGGREEAPSVDWTRDNQLVIGATPEQFEIIEMILAQLDQPGESPRITDFYPLKFAEADKVQNALSYFYGPYAVDVDDPAKKNVQIAADLATNSLVISADENEWVGIRALLEKLDSEEYDASLQLRVMPLTYADARSVARAINEAFRGPIERDSARRAERRSSSREDRDEPTPPRVIIEAEEWVSAAAEEQTNSIVVSASRKNLAKIEEIVSQIDVADFMKMPPPRLIPVEAGSPSLLAASLRELYLAGNPRGGAATRIVPDETSGTIIVRAEDEEFIQIKALADALQQQATSHGLAVHVVVLEHARADRIADAIGSAFDAQADQANAPLAISADTTGNSIIVACTGAMWSEIEATIKQMDGLRPAGGQAVFLIQLEHVPAIEVGDIIENIGLDESNTDGAAGRLLVEPIRISILEDRNALLLVANPADRETLVTIIKAIDAEPELVASQLRIVSLQNADASSVQSVIEELLSGDENSGKSIAAALQEQVRRLQLVRNSSEASALDIDLTKPIRLIADDGANVIIVSSTEANVEAVSALIGLLDQLPSTSAAVIRLFALENIAATQFVRIAREIHDQGRSIGESAGGVVQGVPAGAVGRALMENVALSTDERTNTVIAAGTEDAVALIEVLVQRLDSEIGVGWVEASVVPLRFADAEEVAALIEDVLVKGSTDLPAAVPLQNQAARIRVLLNGKSHDSELFVSMNRLVIRADTATNALVLVGTPTNLRVVRGLIEMMDVESAFPGALVRIYPLQNASATRMSSVLAKLFASQIANGSLRDDDRVEIIPDERTNSIVVSTTTRSFAVLEQLLVTLDVEMPPDIREVRLVELEHSSATRIASIIQRMMDARVERLREIQPETAELERVLVIADDRTNSLVVAAGLDTFETVRRLARDLDEGPTLEHGQVVVVPVATGAIDRLANAIERIMDRRYAEMPAEVARARRPLILTDARSSSLLVAADPEDLASIELLVAQLSKVPMNPAIGLHVMALDRGDVEQFASRLESLMKERSRSLGDAETPTDEVAITADPVSRTMIVAANDENYAVIEGLVEALVAAGAENASVNDIEILSLENQDAEDVVELLEDMYVKDENKRRGETVIRVSAEKRLNAVLINAPKDDRFAIRRIVEQLDNARPSHVVEIRYIALGAANAFETVSLIENVLSGNTLAGRRGSEQATIIRYLHEIEGKREEDGTGIEDALSQEIQTEISSAIRESISLTPDVRTNTIIVRAPREAMTLLERMIRDLDSSNTGNQDIRVFQMTNADADATARILGELFNLRQQGGVYVLKPREATGQVDNAGVQVEDATALGTDLTLVPDQRMSLSITVDSRTNSLLVSGTPTYLDLVSGVVEKLDSAEANERETFVYPLRNAQAIEIANVISNFVAEDQRKLIETLSSEQLPSASRLLEREVTIVGDAKSNAVLVNASPRYREKVMDMIQQLDIDPPQVMIQVLLAEITLDEGEQTGITLNDQVGVVPFRADLGFIGGMLGGGISAPFEVSATDLKLTLAAMQSQRRFQLLSNPSITVANNEEGRIQVGQTLRLPESVATFETGIQNTTVIAQEVGTILTVKPTINPDGFVRMVISPEISKLSDKQLQISSDFSSPIIIKRSATTTVTVRTGETVVIGGLIKGDFEKTNQKIPFLGDLPLIGGLFRSEVTNSSRTELLIVLTPHVIPSPESPNWKSLTNDMIDALPIPERFREQIRTGELDGSSGVLNDAFEAPKESNQETQEK